MHKKVLIFLSAIMAVAIPCLLFAATSASMTSFSVTGSFVAGSPFTITLGNVPDLTHLGPTVTLEGKALTVTAVGKNTITGVLPDGVSKKGGGVKIRYGTETVEGTIYVPFIDNIFLPKVEKGAQINFNGGNFKEKDCTISFPNSSITITRCSQNQILATLGSKLSGGDITVASNGFTSAPYHFDFKAPAIDFVENKAGIIPGSTLQVHVKGLSQVMTENLITLDTQTLQITSFKPNEGLVQVNLPAESAKGSLKLTVNGFESNTLALDANFPPILIDSSFTEEGNVIKVKAVGKYFASDKTKVSLSIGSKTGTVKFANVNNIEAEFPRGAYAGCLMVQVYGQASNCLSFNTTRPPYLKGYLDPILNGGENKYEWTLFAENLTEKNDKLAVYVNGTKADLKGRMYNSISVKFDPIPDKGEVYVVSEGLESNHLPYDFGEQFYPFIASATSNGKFMYAQPVIIKGSNFGEDQFKSNVSINLSGVGLTKDAKTNIPEWKVNNSEITIRLDDKVKKGTKATLSVTVKGKKSNELTFVTGQDNKETLCSPWIQKVQYPEGIMEGSTIRILGQCFDPDPTKNWVYFDTVETKPTFVSSNAMDVKIPSGAKAKGTLKVKTQTYQSNSADYVSAGKTPNAFSFSFENPVANAVSEIGKEGPFAKLLINNTLGEVEMQTLKFKFVYEDDKNDPFSILKLGSLPLGEVKVAFSGEGTKTIPPLVITRDKSNSYGFILDGIRIQPSTQVQSLEFRTTEKPFALNGAKFHLEFDPTKIENFSGLLIQRNKQEVLKLKQNALSSSDITITKTLPTCFDSDSKKVNCSSLMGSGTIQQTATSTKPKLPKIPKK